MRRVRTLLLAVLNHEVINQLRRDELEAFIHSLYWELGELIPMNACGCGRKTFDSTGEAKRIAERINNA